MFRKSLADQLRDIYPSDEVYTELMAIMTDMGFEAPVLGELPVTYIPKILAFAQAMQLNHANIKE